MPEIKNGDQVTVNDPLYGIVTGIASDVVGPTFTLTPTDGYESPSLGSLTPVVGILTLDSLVVARYQMVTT